MSFFYAMVIALLFCILWHVIGIRHTLEGHDDDA